MYSVSEHRFRLAGIVAPVTMALSLIIMVQPVQAAADLCQEMQAYAEKKASEPPKPAQAATGGSAATTPLRKDGEASGTQGGGTTGPSTSGSTSTQSSPPTTAPTSSGAAPEPTTSPHATGSTTVDSGSGPDFKFPGDITLSQLRDIAARGDHQACRDTTQKLRRAGADLPAALIALAAYEPKR